MAAQQNKAMIIHDKELIRNLDCSDPLVFQVNLKYNNQSKEMKNKLIYGSFSKECHSKN